MKSYKHQPKTKRTETNEDFPASPTGAQFSVLEMKI